MTTHLPIERALVERSVTQLGYDVHIVARKEPGWATHIVRPLAPVTIATILIGEAHDRQPAFSLSEGSAQSLMNALWEAGVRPSTGGDDATSLGAVIEAQREHIGDLRRVLGITKPKDEPASGAPLFRP